MRTPRKLLALIAGGALSVATLPLLAPPAQADPQGTGLVISEVFGGGGNSGAPYNADFVELFNPTDSPITLTGTYWLSYYSQSGGSGGSPIALSGTVPARGHWLVAASGGGTGAALPARDSAHSFSMASSGGRVFLQTTATAIGPGGDTSGNDQIVDMVSTAGAASYEGTVGTAAASNTTSLQRKPHAARTYQDTDNTAADIVAAPPTPKNSGDIEGGGGGELTAGDLPDVTATVGAPVSVQLTATGGTPPYTWDVTSGTLPAGLGLTPAGVLSGTPTTETVSEVTVRVTDDAAATDTATFTVTVLAQGAARPIADVQGTGATSPLEGDTVLTEGVVTAAYPTGGFDGFYIQTPGPDTTPGASDGLFVYAPDFDIDTLEIGESVQVHGVVSEFGGLTEITAGTITEIPSLGEVEPKHTIPGTDCALPGTDCLRGAALDAAKEEHEGELFQPTGDYTVTDVYDGSAYHPPNAKSNNFFGEIGIAARSTEPLITPTEVVDAQATAQIAARTAYNDAHRVVLDDGASTTYWNTANTGQMHLPFPWHTPDHQVRVGAAVTFDEPVVLDHRFGWKLQPLRQVTGAPTGQVTFEQTRTPQPEAVGGDLRLATFNVLNYFTTLGASYGGCTPYPDRAGNPIATRSCPDGGPRGAWNQASFERQQVKIVNAINALDADIVTVEEIENSIVVDGHDRDEAMAALVDALNAAAGPGTWNYVESPAEASTAANVAVQDVIRVGFIYRPAAVEVVGQADMLFGSPAFDNAREPFAAVFRPVGGDASGEFAVIANHFKSKGSGPDDGTGQGNANPDRIAQARALADYAASFAADRDVEAVFLTGDINSYSQEDPMQVLYDAGYARVEPDGEHTYSFDGMSGSLDHVLANDAAEAMVTGVDVWETNANETVFRTYSRYNYNATILWDDSVYAASDHNPVIVGLDVPDGAPTTTDVQVLSTNDFHGRLVENGANAAGAAVLSGAVKQLRSQNPNTVFASSGDLIGASTFESFIQDDEPTIDALNAAGLDVSAVGNHELDQGYEDLVGRVQDRASWEYIAANLEEPDGRDDIAPTWTRAFGDIEVGFVGAVTEDLPSLVSPTGIAGVSVTDVVEATNEAAADLKADGADVVVLLVHEGASAASCTSPQFTDESTTWGHITQNTSADVDAIVSAHTHQTYNCSFPVQEWVEGGRAVTERPVVSAGEYGTNLNQLVFTVDNATGGVVGMTQTLLPLTGGAYPADPEVAEIVSAAVAEAETLGARELGRIAAPLNRSKLADGTENRGGESTLGNLVAEVHRWQTRNPESGAAEIAFMNPGGLRDDLLGTVDDGARRVTYKQAAVVQPFANTLVNMDLTGAQIETVLEQQWQRLADGSVPTRPFLRLGVSEGFTYTYEESPVTVGGTETFAGEVTGMWLHGEPIDPAATYSVTVNSFLASGGDNFHALAHGTNRADTGKVDLQAMVDYLAEHAGEQPLPVDYSQRAVGVSGVAPSYAAGGPVTFDVSSWTMSTDADVTDDEVSVELDGEQIGTAVLDNTIGTAAYDRYGTASVDVTLPLDAEIGPSELRLVGSETGTEVVVPIEVTEAPTVVNEVLPTITGTAAVGEPLVGGAGTWSPEPESVSYRWLADGEPIAGATGDEYVVAAGDLGKVITLEVSATAAGHQTGVATSGPTTAVVEGTFAILSAPTVDGAWQVGGTLTGTAGSWSPTPESVSYQWLADGEPIQGATDSSYTLTPAEVGEVVTLRVTVAAAGYADGATTSAGQEPVSPGSFTVQQPPRIDGVPAVGETLSATAGTWSPEPGSVSYQWSADGEPIVGATGPTYVLTPAEAGRTVTVEVTAAREGYEPLAAVSAGAGPVTGTITSEAGPTVAGLPRIGRTLTATPGQWTPEPDSFGFQWLADGAPIVGATGTRLKLRPGHVGKRISVRVTASVDGYADGVATSAATPKVAKGSVKVTAKVTPTKVKVRKVRAWVAVRVTNPDGISAGGRVVVNAKGITKVTKKVVDGKVRLRLQAFRSTGKKVLTIRYTGTGALQGAIVKRTVRVRR